MDQTLALDILRDAAVELLDVPPEAVRLEARFREDLNADSLELVEFVMALEDRFGTRLAQEDLKSIDTVAQALDLILSSKATEHE